MKYLYSSKNGKIYACDDSSFEEILLEHPEDAEVNERDAYMLLFFRISQYMGKKFSNYRSADIQSNVLMMMMERYTKDGLFAPDKSFKDNERIWWSYARKSCYYIIRQFKRKVAKCESIDNLENMDNMCCEQLLYEESFNFEGQSVCQDMIKYFEKLSHSRVYSEMQMGIYALSKIGGLSEEDIMEILGVKYGRIKEIRAELRETIKHKFGEQI